MRALGLVASSARATIARASVVVIAVAALLLVVFVFFAPWGEEFTSGRVPTQFYARLEREGVLDHYRAVFGVAHNSGGTLGATTEALAHGADVIEIDVVSLDGTLYSAHVPPLPIVGNRFFRGPSLAEVWDTAAEADVIKLDLKESSPAYLDLLFAFLAARPDREVIIVTGNERALATFNERFPRAVPLLSVGSNRRLRDLRRQPDLVALVDGVTIRQGLLDADTAAWLEESGLLVRAWTVNDLERLNELVGMGVDAITTDNLAIMELLGGERRGEAWLRDRVRR